MSLQTNLSINRFHNDKWSINFSNIPSVDKIKTDIQLYNLYVKTVVLPDLFIETVDSQILNSSYRHPMSRINDNLTQLTIEFKADEYLENYYNLYEYMQQLRYGVTGSLEDTLRRNTIKSIDVVFLDNQKRDRGRFRFTEAMLINLGSLTLDMGSAEEVTFAASFTYEEVKLVKQGPEL
jgi:hypothetical protein